MKHTYKGFLLTLLADLVINSFEKVEFQFFHLSDFFSYSEAKHQFCIVFVFFMKAVINLKYYSENLGQFLLFFMLKAKNLSDHSC